MRTAVEVLPAAASDLTIGDLWPIYLRRRQVFYVLFGSVVGLAILYCAIATRRFEATGTVQVQNETTGGMQLSEVFNGQVVVPDALTTALDLETQADILKSDTLALQVIHELNLEQTAEFQRKGLLTRVLDLLPLPKSAAGNSEPVRRTRALKIFANHLKVKVESGTRLIDISYRSPDPALSALVVNHMIDALVNFNLQTRFTAGNHASQWLSGQLGDLRTQSENLQARVVQLQQQMGVFSLGDTDFNGSQQVYSTVLDQVQKATAALTVAQSNRILKGAIYQAVKSGSPELISGLSGNAMGQASVALTNSLELIQNLRGQEATLNADIAQSAAKFGADYPPLIEKRAALAGMERSIAAESDRIAARAKSDYEVAVQNEENTRKLFDETRKGADQLDSKAIEYAIAQKEAEETRGLYEDLTRRLREAGLVQGLRSSNIVTVDPGRTPAAPSSPKVPLLMLAAIGGGFFIGSAGAFLADVVDRRVQTVDEVEHGELPLLGIVPFLKSKPGPWSMDEISSSRSAFHQAMRGLRTSLMLNNVLPAPGVLLVTSAMASEGKSTIAKGLCVVMAQQGRRVLLIEADMYRPSLGRDFHLEDSGGLSMVLREQTRNPEDSMVTPLPALPNFLLLQAGHMSSESVDLLESRRMRDLVTACRDQFDTIVIDGPPILPVTDAVPLSMLADTTVLVARMGQTPRISFTRAYHKLQMHVRNCDVRVVLNAVKSGSYDFYNYYGSTADPFGQEEQRADA